MHEYSSLFPNMSPLNNKFRGTTKTEQLFSKLQQRLGAEFDVDKGEVNYYLFY